MTSSLLYLPTVVFFISDHRLACPGFTSLVARCRFRHAACMDTLKLSISGALSDRATPWRNPCWKLVIAAMALVKIKFAARWLKLQFVQHTTWAIYHYTYRFFFFEWPSTCLPRVHLANGSIPIPTCCLHGHFKIMNFGCSQWPCDPLAQSLLKNWYCSHVLGQNKIRGTLAQCNLYNIQLEQYTLTLTFFFLSEHRLACPGFTSLVARCRFRNAACMYTLKLSISGALSDRATPWRNPGWTIVTAAMALVK